MISKQISKMLSDGIANYLAERRDGKLEDYLKSKPQKKKDKVSKGINIRLANIVRRLTDQNQAVKEIERTKKAKEQTALAFQQEKYNNLLALIDTDSTDNELIEVKQEYSQAVSELERQHNPSIWLDEWTKKAKDISFATHVAKLTHSSSKGSSILDSTKSEKYGYLTTNKLIEIEVDTASSNAASLPIADILKIEYEGVSVLDCVKAGDTSLFDAFTDDKTQIENWVVELKQAYDSDAKRSYFLSKQVYFPLDDGRYHLLLPLTSSSLAQAIHDEQRRYFNDEQTQARAQKKEQKYSAVTIVSYSNKARLNVTASNHSNASALNGKRGGKLTLFSAQPPKWQVTTRNYKDQNESALFKALAYELKQPIAELNTYLTLLKKKDLSDSQPTRAAAITRKVQAISHGLFDYIMLINANEQHGWTQTSNLPLLYQLLFEPYRDDNLAKAEKVSKEWQSVISKAFGCWLNKRLDKKLLQLNTLHSELWTRLFAQELREFVALQEVSS
ncbi:type I-F CRISPR-associated protein Csy1 [Shewanella chilikensis]|uniref:type I-F CRISPR-associated protein Csy1 n=1 Tax=Shewanella chilikensis TaxID=558541 RepID=UPI00399C0295